jgi:hypothetical protein
MFFCDPSVLILFFPPSLINYCKNTKDHLVSHHFLLPHLILPLSSLSPPQAHYISALLLQRQRSPGLCPGAARRRTSGNIDLPPYPVPRGHLSRLSSVPSTFGANPHAPLFFIGTVRLGSSRQGRGSIRTANRGWLRVRPDVIVMSQSNRNDSAITDVSALRESRWFVVLIEPSRHTLSSGQSGLLETWSGPRDCIHSTHLSTTLLYCLAIFFHFYSSYGPSFPVHNSIFSLSFLFFFSCSHVFVIGLLGFLTVLVLYVSRQVASCRTHTHTRSISTLDGSGTAKLIK